MPTSPKTNSKAVAEMKTAKEIKEYLNRSRASVDPDVVLQLADQELHSSNKDQLSIQPTSNIFKAMTLLEFDNGTLLTTVISEEYKTFGIDMLRQLQKEYHCETFSEKATTELATISYIRTLEIQSRINRYLALTTISDMGVRFLAVMSKELDRANRHYLASIQTLKAMKQSPMQLNIKTDTAIIGQNQLVQANSHE